MYIYKTDNSHLKAVKKENLRNKELEKAIYQLYNNIGSQLNTFKKKIEGFTEN